MKIWDCFTYYNEKTVLDIRFHELAPIVDGFVVVEARQTHTGQPKPINFQPKLYQHVNVQHLIVDLPHQGDITDEEVWRNENAQRNAIARVLQTKSPYDLAMISDADEIPPRELVATLASKFQGPPCIMRQRISYYYLNLIRKEGGERQRDDGPHTTVTGYVTDILRASPQVCRQFIWSHYPPFVVGGWHLHALGGFDTIKLKLNSCADARYRDRSDDEIRVAISEGRDLIGGEQILYAIPLDDSFPHLVREQPERFKDLILV